MKKFESLSSKEKTEYFYEDTADLFPEEIFKKLGVKYDENWERKSGSDIEVYMEKYAPAAYKKSVQRGYKNAENATLAGTPKKGYKNVKKSDIISSVSKKTGATKKATKEIVKAYWDTIKETIKKDSENAKKDSKSKSKTKKELSNINIPNVGSIRLVATKARKVKISGLKNAKKGKGKKTEITVPSKLVPKFYVSGNFLAKESTSKAKPKTRSKGKGTKSKRTKNK